MTHDPSTRGHAGEAGSRGPRVRSDCWIRFEPAEKGGLEIELKSTAEAYYGESIDALLREGCAALGAEHGALLCEDGGAVPFVLMARLEAAIREAGLETKGDWLPPIHDPARGATRRDRFRRSRLYLPGSQPKLFLNAGLHRPDAIILDLEDSVAPAAKLASRILVRNALRQVDFMGAERMVRINQGELGLSDLEQIAPHGVDLILIPKVESAGEVQAVDGRIRELSADEVFLMPIIESARGVANATEIAGASDRNVALTIGLEDYTADIGVQRTESGEESLWARCAIVNAARAFGLQAIDSVYSDVGNVEGLRASVDEARRLGFEGKGCIHPRQIGVVHAALAPAANEVDRARRIVRAFRKAEARGLGVVSLGTRMIDPPVVKRALATVDMAIATGRLAGDWESADEE
ncbi:MAG: citrate lyase ACP [Gemmatimonadetes bacterium]|nr:citrate lyase ACP [Gemmatimonadota bacterium]